jgi:hypothetical protein
MKKIILENGWGLKLRDFIKGMVLAVGTPVLYLVQEMIPTWPLTKLESIALSAIVTYLLKNYFTDDIKTAKRTLRKAADKHDVSFVITPDPNKEDKTII